MSSPGKRVLVYLVRHGETQENRDGIIQGQKDTLLNLIGETQARSIGERFKGMAIDFLISSDLSRAISTAESILVHHPGLKLLKQEELRERDMGPHLEGKKLDEAANLAPPSETAAAFAKRVIGWWNKQVLGTMLSKTDEVLTVVVTTHGGVITTLVKQLIGSRKAECGQGVVIAKCFNASVTLIEVGDDRKGAVLQYGDISHISGEALESRADLIQALKNSVRR